MPDKQACTFPAGCDPQKAKISDKIRFYDMSGVCDLPDLPKVPEVTQGEFSLPTGGQLFMQGDGSIWLKFSYDTI